MHPKKGVLKGWNKGTHAHHNMRSNRHSIKNDNNLPVPIPVVFGNNGRLNALGKGDVNLFLEENKVLIIDNVYFVLESLKSYYQFAK